MTITAPGLGAPGLASPGISYQQGFGPGFPTPIGAEQLFGSGQHYGVQPSFWPQAPYGMQDLYGRPAAGHVMPQQVQQLVGQLTGQILPVAEQIVLPQVIALAVQLVQQHVQQLMTQVAVPQITGQYPVPVPQWQQPFWGHQPAAFGPTVRTYAGLS
jgi:hypothetical protein